ncbi:MAG: LysR family transcriptional regulator [Pseudomonadota bacterium]
MDIDSLRLFVLAADRLNISAAGRILGIAPAVASARLAKLEKAVGSELLHRSTRKVSLSIEGEEFLPYAREILAQHAAALEALGHGTSEPKGTIRFAATSTFAQRYIIPLVAEFLTRYPGIDLDLRLSDVQFDLIEGSYDLALRNQSLTDSSLKARKLAEASRILCAAPNYLSKRGTPTTPDDLADHELIGFQSQTPRPLIGPGGKPAQFNPARGQCRLVVDDGLSLKLATMAGAGISINALWSVHDELRDGTLVRVLPDYTADDDTGLWLVYPKSNVLTAKTRVLIDFLVEKIGAAPPWLM